MNEKLLGQIHDEQHKYGEFIRPPATEESLNALCAEVRRVFSTDLPEGYLRFLTLSDGLDFNGLVIYDCASTPEQSTDGFWQGFVAANLVWRDNPENNDLLVFGDSDMDIYAQHIDSGSFRRIDKIGHDRFEIFASFDTMIESALQSRL